MKTAKLFKNGGSQAVRLPKEFRFEGDFVYIRKIGTSVVLIPHYQAWQTLWEGVEGFSSDYMENRAQPEVEERDEPFE